MGDEVTIFFTFWGLNLLRKAQEGQRPRARAYLQKMFGMMMHKGTGKLGLSKMNFCGIGVRLMKVCMKKR